MNNAGFEQQFANRRQMVNIHIPKTAGTTFRAQIMKVVPLVPIDLGGQGDDPTLPYYERYCHMLQQNEIRLAMHEDYFVTGHFRYRDLAKATPDLCQKASVMTFLRNPIARILSDYHYSASDIHPGSQGFMATYPNFETYMRSHGQANKQLEYLMLETETSVDQTIERVSREFAFVGITENYEKCANWFFDHIGKTAPPLEHLNRNTNRENLKENRERHIDELREIMKPELKLYNHFKAMWE